jgi:hypothetical protein
MGGWWIFPPNKRAKGRQAFMKSVLIAIVYHSGNGHTRRQAEAVKTGVEQVEDAEACF